MGFSLEVTSSSAVRHKAQAMAGCRNVDVGREDKPGCLFLGRNRLSNKPLCRQQPAARNDTPAT
ncbi:MAG TPA: hypothetical protein DDY14_06300 [Chromatiaceae bacterium]|nr:hypothetical protein [Chromatiaceae bacterium]